MSVAYFSLTQKCTHNCIVCPCSAPKEQRSHNLSFEKFETDIHKAKENGLSGVVLSGGEPTLHPDFFKILAFLASQNLQISLLTTAEKFASESFCEDLLKNYDPHNVRVITAIHSFDSEIHDSITRLPGSLAKTLQGLDNLYKMGCKITVKHLAIKPTVASISGFVKRFYDKYPDDVALVLCNIDFKGNAYENKDLLWLDLRKTGELMDEALDFVEGKAQEGSQRSVKVYDTPYCTIDHKHWKYLRSQAKLLLALYDDPTNSRDKVDQFVRNSSGPFFDACKNCLNRLNCPGTWHSRTNVEAELPLRPFLEQET